MRPGDTATAARHGLNPFRSCRPPPTPPCSGTEGVPAGLPRRRRREDTPFNRTECRRADHSDSGRGPGEPRGGQPRKAVPSTPVADLCQARRWRQDENPLDIWAKLVAHADENKFPDEADTFRFKYHGLFYVAPAQDSFMLRLRVPAAELAQLAQLPELAELAHDFGGRLRAAITTRGSLQIQEFQAARDIVQTLTRVQELGLTSRGAGADNIRNITASPRQRLHAGRADRRPALRQGAPPLHPQPPRPLRPPAPGEFNVALRQRRQPERGGGHDDNRLLSPGGSGRPRPRRPTVRPPPRPRASTSRCSSAARSRPRRLRRATPGFCSIAA